ncbi:pentatricopeptide repeat-containing protein MRL1, chloroplastic [Rosa rugosa]|uniref:pentatricopeptide repeat-containing protein MRL1, chloroplastic n=1 Tax=Rosa rugosa TaxID=74645 RepID=UPI002B410631|nr:pentatricopeptide repeat-containing protein MRL1, chloroplastic [Rosa rugosa]
MSFSAKPQPLALISCTPHSRSLRRDFLGCAHSLRPLAGGLRSLRKNRSPAGAGGRQNPPPRLLIKASLGSHSILVLVAVVTFSAVSIVYFNRSVKPKKREVSGEVEVPVEDQSIDFDALKDEIREAREEEEASSSSSSSPVLQFHNSSVISAQESSPSLSPLVFESTAVLQPLHFPTEVTEFDKLEPLFELPNLMGDSDFGSVTVSDEEVVTESTSVSGSDEESSEVGEANGFGLRNGESDREEIHMFYEANKSEMKLDDDKFSSFLRNSTLTRSDSFRQVSHHSTTENAEGKIPNHKEGHVRSREDLGNGNGYNGHVADKELRHLPKKNHKTVPQPNGIHTSDAHYVSEQLSAYHRLLKDGRLSDSLSLLEDLEKKDLLDMNKVYHGRFFETCKKKKAVDQAFRFIKLIPNPTMSTYNMLMSVCASAQDSEGAFNVLGLVREAGLRVDCKLYTTLISTCAKSGKVYTMFDVFHEMVSAGVEPNVHTYGALIDGCGRAGEVAKAFGAYGIMRSKKVKPDRVVFNALITACGQSGAVDRAFDVLEEMKAETQPIEPDHTTVGALIKACANAGQVERAREVYKMIHKYKIKGSSEVYTIAVNCCSLTGDWDFACTVYDDMTRNGVVPDEMFLSALIDVAGHAGKLDAAFEIIQEARNRGIQVGTVSYSSLMGACSNAKNWQKALELYEDLKSAKIEQTVSTVNALITALCDGDQLQKAMEVLSEMKSIGLRPNSITYSILVVASEKKDDLDAGLMLLSQAEKDKVVPNLVMCRCIIGMCLRRSEKACTLGETVLPLDSGRPQVDSKWASVALMVYRKTIVAGAIPTIEIISQVLGCLQLPFDASFKKRVIENLGVTADTSRPSKLCSLIDGFGEYDPRAFSLLEEAASLGIVPCVSFKVNPIVVDAKKLQLHTAKVYILTVLRGLKHRLAAGSKLPNMTILLPVEKTQILSPKGKMKTIYLSGRVGQSVAALLRRLGLHYQGNESRGKIRISGLTMKRWFQPKLASPFTGKPEELGSSQLRLGKGITHQQRNIRTGNFSLD